MHCVNVTGNPEMSEIWSLPSRHLQRSLRTILKKNSIR